MEFISTFPTSEIVLKIEEIPPMDTFYSPKHKFVMRRQRKIRRIEQSQLLVPRDFPMELVWKDSQSNLSQDLTHLTQFTGAYAYATIDKATKVQHLIK